MIGSGVFAGASNPVHEFTSKPVKPCSLIVGKSGNCGERLSDAIPSGRRRPDLICADSAVAPVQIIGIWPESTSIIAMPAPLYGMWTISMPAIDLNNSPHRCGEPPLPLEAKFICPGFALASAISSLMLFAGTAGLTTNM